MKGADTWQTKTNYDSNMNQNWLLTAGCLKDCISIFGGDDPAHEGKTAAYSSQAILSSYSIQNRLFILYYLLWYLAFFSLTAEENID